MSTSLYRFDETLTERYKVIAGIDEAGRGSLAGPVVAAAVVLPKKRIRGINDSKKLSPETREYLYKRISGEALAWSVGVVSEKQIDKIGILAATLNAAQLAVKKLALKVNLVVFDGNTKIPGLKYKQLCVISGDQKSACVAAASIMAKVTRDALMKNYCKKYPEYGFSRHKGYGTAVHINLLNQFGPSPIHRFSFHPVLCASQKKQA